MKSERKKAGVRHMQKQGMSRAFAAEFQTKRRQITVRKGRGRRISNGLILQRAAKDEKGEVKRKR